MGLGIELKIEIVTFTLIFFYGGSVQSKVLYDQEGEVDIGNFQQNIELHLYSTNYPYSSNSRKKRFFLNKDTYPALGN